MSAWKALGLGAISGLRSMSGPALVSRAASSGCLDIAGTRLGFMGSSRLSKTLTLMALGELVADKLSIVPSRSAPPVLLWRVASGGLVGAALFVSEHRHTALGIVLGSTAAVAAALTGERLRALAGEKTGLSDPLVALVEDSIVLLVGFGSLKGIR